ncbi:restriction endonuclease [Brevibacillus choshinensis]|uniref:Restriction endonuclease n=1 Tax=Brevibacillus choshinensis TaxID=54911 RepID=A0ABX7FSK6_BRECH|nr:restriction endonuclease [Brevibacillus choshinensis]QRG68622.1 restriction endonuclease [Brevibacillus choshinensis]
MGTNEWILVLIVALGFFASIFCGKKQYRKTSKQKGKKYPKNMTHRTSLKCRSDEIILTCNLDDLSGAEFERLLALYFRDQGYTVKEVGVGGNDGGVDLVIIDKRGEKTAVQAKCYADGNNVGVQVVRELVGAKRNHDCILSLLVTTSDLTQQAKKEAEQFKVDYWHGAIVEQKLKTWGKWNPIKKRNAKSKPAVSEIQLSRLEVAATGSVHCVCGAPMIKRKNNKTGEGFWGCSKYPSCKKTKPV